MTRHEPHYHWYIPSDYDGRVIVPGSGPGAPRIRKPGFEYLVDVVRAAENNGFESVLTVTGSRNEDVWVTASMLAARTTKLRFIIANRTGQALPTTVAQAAASFSRFTGGRVDLNIVSGADRGEFLSYGDTIEFARRYDRTAEFITVLRKAWAGGPFDFKGEHFHIEGGGQNSELDRPPLVFFGGASPEAERIAVQHADVQLIWGEPPPMAYERLAPLRDRAAALGRDLRTGIRLHVIARPTEEEAWAEADRLLDKLDPETVSRAQAAFSSSLATGVKRQQSLNPGNIADREALKSAYPGLWTGPGVVKGATAIVGSFERVAEVIQAYRDVGISHFILSGYPQLEEAYWVGEEVLPLLGRRESAPQVRSVA